MPPKSLGAIFHDSLEGDWSQAKGHLREELEQLRGGLMKVIKELNATQTVASGDNVTFLRTAILTDDDIKALPSTAFDIVAAPGLGFRLVPVTIDVLVHIETVYSNIDPDAQLFVRADGQQVSNALINESTIGYTQLNDLLGATGDFQFSFVPYTLDEPINAYGNLVVPTTDFRENEALQLTLDNNGAGDLTGGTSANYITVSTLYYPMELT